MGLEQLPAHVLPMIGEMHRAALEEAAKAARLESSANLTEWPHYTWCRFCGALVPVDWRPRTDASPDYTVEVVDICRSCGGFRKLGPITENIDEFMRRVTNTHLMLYHPEAWSELQAGGLVGIHAHA